MSNMEKRRFMNPIALEANMFLKTIEKYGAQYQVIDEELLTTMDKLVKAINEYCGQSQTKFTETNDMELIKVMETDFIMRAYQCKKCYKFLGPSADKAVRHIGLVHSKLPSNREKSATTDEESVSVLQLPKKARHLLTRKIAKNLSEVYQIAEPLKQIPEYEVIENDLISALQCLYPDKNFKIFKFGSRISGVGNADSDLDIFVDIDNSFNNNNEATVQTVDVIKKLSNALKEDIKWSQVMTYENTHVPIIRLNHVSTKIVCDIGFSNSLAFCNTMLMTYLFELQPIAACICLFLKSWLECTRLKEHFFTYSLTLMVIYYLQMHLVLPSIEDLQKGLEKEEFIGPWLSNFRRKSLKELNLKQIEVNITTFREHLYNFFVFYGEFNFKQFLVCPYKGVLVDIAQISKILPERYKSGNKTQGELQLNTPIVVQDPIELNKNTTRSKSKSLLKVMVAYFMESAKILRLYK